jgi:hypothetical protein
MSVNGVPTIFVISTSKTQRVPLHSWLIIELSPAFLGKTWLWQHWDYVLNMSVNWAWTTFGLPWWKMQGLRGNIQLSLNYRPPFYPKMVPTTSQLCPKNECQRSVNDFWPQSLAKAWVVWRHWLLIDLSASVLGKNASVNLTTVSHNERQWSVKEFWLCILHNLMAIERR